MSARLEHVADVKRLTRGARRYAAKEPQMSAAEADRLRQLHDECRAALAELEDAVIPN